MFPLWSLSHPNTCNIYGSNNIHQFLSGHQRIIIIIHFGSSRHYELIKIHINISFKTSKHNVCLGSPSNPNNCNIWRTNNILQFLSGHRRIIIVPKFRLIYHISSKHPTINFYRFFPLEILRNPSRFKI